MDAPSSLSQLQQHHHHHQQQQQLQQHAKRLHIHHHQHLASPSSSGDSAPPPPNAVTSGKKSCDKSNQSSNFRSYVHSRPAATPAGAPARPLAPRNIRLSVILSHQSSVRPAARRMAAAVRFGRGEPRHLVVRNRLTRSGTRRPPC